MKARDLMTSPVICVGLDATVRDFAKLMVEQCISAVPILAGTGKMAGIVPEGDLLRRDETWTENISSWRRSL